jgi:glycosyltransferase involved in cell wall biosynthesis
MGKRTARRSRSTDYSPRLSCVYDGPAQGDVRVADEAPSLTIVVPAFNEELRLSAKAAQLNHAVQNGVFDPAVTELIVVDDGSTDGTAHLAEQILSPSFHRLRVLQLERNSGKGAAIRAGIAAAGAPIVAFMDADMSVDPTQIPLLLGAIEDAEVVVGSRSLPDSIVENFHIRRKYMGRAFSHLVNSLTDVAIGDTQCGFKAFRTPNARMLFHLMMADGFAFDAEVLYLARKLGMSIGEVPVVWRDNGGSTVRLSDPTTMAVDVFRTRFRRKWPAISALEIATSPERGERPRHGIPNYVFETVGPNFPILQTSNDRALILFPLSRPHDLSYVILGLSQLMPEASVVQRTVELADLIRLAPLVILAPDGDETTAVTDAADTENSPLTRESKQPVNPVLD